MVAMGINVADGAIREMRWAGWEGERMQALCLATPTPTPARPLKGEDSRRLARKDMR